MKKEFEALNHLVDSWNCLATSRDRNQLEKHLEKAKKKIDRLKNTGKPYAILFDAYDLGWRCLSGDSLKDEFREKVNACVRFFQKGRPSTGEYPVAQDDYEAAGKTQE